LDISFLSGLLFWNVLSLCDTLRDKIGNFLEKVEFQLVFWTQLLVFGRLLAAGVLPTHHRHVS
jgi:hypothetical protein